MKPAAALILWSACCFGQSVISGTVVSASGNAPLSKVLVSISPTQLAMRQGGETAGMPRIAITGSDGRFAFLNVPAGKYNLTAARPNDPPQSYLGNGPFSTAIVTGGAVSTTDLVFPYHSGSAIDGTVSDDSGEPIAHAQVFLFRRDTSNGRSQIVNAGQNTTGSRGAFHFGHLSAGDYFAGVSARPWYARNPPPSQQNTSQQNSSPQNSLQPNQQPGFSAPRELDVAYPFTYYPGVQEFSEASAIKVTEGNAASIQMTLRAVPALHIHLTGGGQLTGGGEAVNQKQGMRPMGQLMVLGPDGRPIAAPGSIVNGEEVSGVAPGHYELNTHSGRGMRFPERTGKVVDLTGDGTVDLSGTAKTAVVSGMVTTEGSEKPMNFLLVSLTNEETGANVTQMVSENGTFEFPEGPLNPGQYRLGLRNTAAFFIKKAEVKGAKYQAGLLELKGGTSAQITMLIAPNAQHKLEGIAVSDDRPVAGAMVLLLPVSGNPQLIRRDQSDLDGSFTLAGVNAGEYRLVAIDDGRDLLYLEQGAMEPSLGAALKVTIGNEDSPALKVQVQKRVRPAGSS